MSAPVVGRCESPSPLLKELPSAGTPKGTGRKDAMTNSPLKSKKKGSFMNITRSSSGRSPIGRRSPSPVTSPEDYKAGRLLLRACCRGNLNLVQSLFKKYPGLDVNFTNTAKETPLFFAAASSAAICSYLLDRGADPLIRAKGNRTVAHQLAVKGDAQLWQEFCKYESFKKLLKKDLKSEDELIHPLHLAVKRGHLELITIFEKWDLDIRDDNGSSPLIIAVGEGQYEVALYLLSKNVKLGVNSLKYRSREMHTDRKHPVLHIMIVSDFLVSSDRMYKKVMKELIAQKAPLGCMYCSDGKGCTTVAKRRVAKYKALKEAIKIEAKNVSNGVTDKQVKSLLLPLIKNEDGMKGGLWRGIMQSGAREGDAFGRNLILLFQKLEIEDDATRAVLFNEIETHRKVDVIISEKNPFTQILLGYIRNEGKHFTQHFTKVYYECEFEPTVSVMALRFFLCTRSNICFFPAPLRSLLLDVHRTISEKFGEEIGDKFLKKALFDLYLSSSLFSSSSDSPITEELKQDTHVLVKKIIGGEPEKPKGDVAKSQKELEFVYQQFLDRQFETSSSMLRVRSPRRVGVGRAQDIQEEDRGSSSEDFCNFFHDLMTENGDVLEDAILKRPKDVSKKETLIKCQLIEYFGESSA